MNKKSEIERKFLVKRMPDLTAVKGEIQERYFLELGNIEKRITKIDDKYFYEEKSRGNGLTSKKVIREISGVEFEKLKKISIKSLKRKCYILTIHPEVSIKVYDDEYLGLVRAEFEFESENEAKSFAPPEWCGIEITKTDLGRDGKLIKLEGKEFLNLLCCSK